MCVNPEAETLRQGYRQSSGATAGDVGQLGSTPRELITSQEPTGTNQDQGAEGTSGD